MKRSACARSLKSWWRSANTAPGMWPAAHSSCPGTTRKPGRPSSRGRRKTVHSSTQRSGLARFSESHSVVARKWLWSGIYRVLEIGLAHAEAGGEGQTPVAAKRARRDLDARRRLAPLVLVAVDHVDDAAHGLFVEARSGDLVDLPIFFYVTLH